MAKTIHVNIYEPIGLIDDFWSWSGFTAQHLAWQLEYEEFDHLVLHINSPGGEVMEGYTIYNKLLSLKEAGKTVEVQIEGMCFSIATLIALAASPGMLKARKASMWMVHKPLFSMLFNANADSLRKSAQELDTIENTLASIYAQKTGKELSEIQEHMRGEILQSPDEAKAYGFIDAILEQESPTAVNMAPAGGKYKAVATYRPTSNLTNTDKMTEEEKKGLGSIVAAALTSALSAFGFKAKNEGEAPAEGAENNAEGTIVAESTTLEDGSAIYFEGELAQGSAVFADSEMTEAYADGTYTLSDGREIEVVEGQVSNITEAEEEVAAAVENNSQPDAVAALTKRISAMEAKEKKHQATIKALQDQLQNFVPGGGDDSQKPEQQFITEKPKATGNAFDAIANNARKPRK